VDIILHKESAVEAVRGNLLRTILRI